MGDEGWVGAADTIEEGSMRLLAVNFPPAHGHRPLIPEYSQVFGFASHNRGVAVLLPQSGVIN